jgi:hypothetical protein
MLLVVNHTSSFDGRTVLQTLRTVTSVRNNYIPANHALSSLDARALSMTPDRHVQNQFVGPLASQRHLGTNTVDGSD